MYENFIGMHRRRLILFTLLFVFIATFATLSIRLTKKTNAASLTGASVTLSNSRMSFKAPITSGAAGSTLVTISGAVPDTTTKHLFPGDALCFTDAGNNVCRDNKTYTVASVPSDTTIELTTTLTTALTATDFAVASQSGAWAITFTTVNAIPVGGKIILTIPMADAASGNNGIPDGAVSLATGGFDLNKEASASATVGGTCATNWGTAVITPGYGTTDSTITWTRASTVCAGGAVQTIAIAIPGFVNPAPITGHVQGQADVYGINIATTDGTNTLDSAVPKVAPVEAVLISATVDETLTFQVAAVSGANLYANPTWCGTIPSSSDAVTTFPYSVPWGHFGASNHFYYGAQQLTVSTNAASGYVVTLQESDQMGRNGNVCTGVTPSPPDYTFGSGTCIRDTVCSAGGCDHTTATDWTDAATYPGLGYSLATVSGSGTDAPFWFGEKTRAWSAKDMADYQGGETAGSVPTIMSNSGPVSGNSIYVCYRISVPGTQPSGYYYNIAKYTATATF